MILTMTETLLSPKVLICVLQLTMGNELSVATSTLMHKTLAPLFTRMRFLSCGCPSLPYVVTPWAASLLSKKASVIS